MGNKPKKDKLAAVPKGAPMKHNERLICPGSGGGFSP